MSENKNCNIFEEINKKYFSEIEHSIPHIQQTLFDLQNEFYKTWKNTVNANTKLYQEFLSDSRYKVPKYTKDILINMGEEIIKYRSMYNKLTIQNIESMKNNVKPWNENKDIFVDLNRKIMHYWLSAFSPKTNNP